MLTSRGQELYNSAALARKHILEMALQTKFPDTEQRAQYLDLIGTYGNPSVNEFIEYKDKGPTPVDYKYRHWCRATAKFIKHFEPKLTIRKLETHPLMQQLCGLITGRLGPRTFQTWMNEEGIYDRKKSK